MAIGSDDVRRIMVEMDGVDLSAFQEDTRKKDGGKRNDGGKWRRGGRADGLEKTIDRGTS